MQQLICHAAVISVFSQRTTKTKPCLVRGESVFVERPEQSAHHRYCIKRCSFGRQRWEEERRRKTPIILCALSSRRMGDGEGKEVEAKGECSDSGGAVQLHARFNRSILSGQQGDSLRSTQVDSQPASMGRV